MNNSQNPFDKLQPLFFDETTRSMIEMFCECFVCVAEFC